MTAQPTPGPWQTAIIEGREYLIFATPFCN